MEGNERRVSGGGTERGTRRTAGIRAGRNDGLIDPKTEGWYVSSRGERVGGAGRRESSVVGEEVDCAGAPVVLQRRANWSQGPFGSALPDSEPVEQEVRPPAVESLCDFLALTPHGVVAVDAAGVREKVHERPVGKEGVRVRVMDGNKDVLKVGYLNMTSPGCYRVVCVVVCFERGPEVSVEGEDAVV